MESLPSRLEKAQSKLAVLEATINLTPSIERQLDLLTFEVICLENRIEEETAKMNSGHIAVVIEKVKHGEPIRFKVNGPVYYKGDYCRENKGWFCGDSRDISNTRIAKKGKTVFIGFTY